jgi:hypothetical protein
VDPVSRYCTNCGHQLDVGRYCTNCGARVTIAAEATDEPADYPTAVRPGPIEPIPWVEPPPPPPPFEPPPSSARYPLYADTVTSAEPSSYAAPPAPAPGSAPRSPLPWVIAIVVLALIALTGGALLLLAPSDDSDADDRSGSHGRRGGDVGPTDVLEPADVQVPETAPPSVDEGGGRVTFRAVHMLDADPRTSWRMSGNGTGAVITFTFDDPVTVTEVGMVNGYAKSDPPHDWYAGNRRITAVAWVFDDGTEVTQDLGDDLALQSTPVAPVETTHIELRILEVTEPGEGPDGRDFTAISDVAIIGAS